MKNTNLSDFIKVYDNVFDGHSCKQLIDIFETCSEYHEIHDNDTYKFRQLNFNAHKETFPIAQGFVHHLISYYEKYFDDVGLSQYVNISGFEEVRLKKYTLGDESQFKTHVDVADLLSSKRSLVAILYLNDNDGCTNFPTLDISVKPKVGRVVMFPPTWMFPHAGLPPTDKDKYIIMTCLHYT
jgi:prolyl 4-hydroxylase